MLQYAKAIVGGVGTLAMLVYAALSDEAITFDEANGIWLAVLAVLTATGVYTVPNKTSG